MKLVDTDIFIDFFRGVPQALIFFQQTEELFFSAITEAELLSGKICNDANQREKVFHLLAQFDKVPVDNPLVQVAADLRRKYTIELPDALIAASALVVNVPLFTRNVRDFKKITELKVEEPY